MLTTDTTPTKARDGATRLTASMIPSLPEGDHTDPAARGLQLRVRVTKRTGAVSRTWLFRFKWRKEWVRLTIGHVPQMSLVDARERAIELRRALDDGIDPRRARPQRRVQPAPIQDGEAIPLDHRHSIDALVSDFAVRYLRPNRKDPKQAENILACHVLPAWQGRDARSITSHEVLDLLDGIVDAGHRAMANKVAGLLELLFKFAIHRRIVESTPVQLLMPPGGYLKPRKRTLADEELRALLQNPYAYMPRSRFPHAAMVLLLTGQRRGELAKAAWRNVSFAKQIWYIPAPDAKNDDPTAVPLSDMALQEFEMLRKFARDSRWVLPMASNADVHIPTNGLSIDQMRKRQKITNLLGIQPYNLHDLRRTCRTGLGKLKVPKHVCELILNHRQRGIAAVYDTGDYLDDKRLALDKWAEWLAILRDKPEEEWKAELKRLRLLQEVEE